MTKLYNFSNLRNNIINLEESREDLINILENLNGNSQNGRELRGCPPVGVNVGYGDFTLADLRGNEESFDLSSESNTNRTLNNLKFLKNKWLDEDKALKNSKPVKNSQENKKKEEESKKAGKKLVFNKGNVEMSKLREELDEYDDNIDECIICNEVFNLKKNNEIGVLDECGHIFCFNCILIWSNRINLCPLCKGLFTHIRKINLANIQLLINHIYDDILEVSSGSQKKLEEYKKNKLVDSNNNNNNGNNYKNNNNNSEDEKEDEDSKLNAENGKDRKRRILIKNRNIKINKLKKIIKHVGNWHELIATELATVKPGLKLVEGNLTRTDEGCEVCNRNDDWPNLLLCDHCDRELHTYCLNPPLSSVPEGSWYCPSCVGLNNFSEHFTESNLSNGNLGQSGSNELTNNNRNNNNNNNNSNNNNNNNTYTRVRNSRISNLLAHANEIIEINTTRSEGSYRPRNLLTGLRDQVIEIQDEDELEIDNEILSQIYQGLNKSSRRGRPKKGTKRNVRKTKTRWTKPRKRTRTTTTTESTESTTRTNTKTRRKKDDNDEKEVKRDKRKREGRKKKKVEVDSGLDYYANKNINEIIRESMESIDNFLINHLINSTNSTNSMNSLNSTNSMNSSNSMNSTFNGNQVPRVEEHGNSTSLNNSNRIKYLF